MMETIKFVIWGAGAWGKRAFNAIGEKDVKAFIDSDTKKVGTIYCGKEVIDISQYTIKYADCILLIANGHFEECCSVLREKNINTFLLYKDVPGELFNIYTVGYNELKDYVLNMCEEDELYSIKGISFYSLVVYNWINETGKRVQLIVSRTVSEQMISLLQLYDVCFVYEDDSPADRSNIIFICDRVDAKHPTTLLCEQKEYRYIYDCSKEIEAYHNPQLQSFRNIHTGKRCFIVATGPSLLMEDLNVLKRNREICFSVNSIYKAFDKTKWRPDYYVVSDVNFMLENEAVVDSMDLPCKLVADQCMDFWKYKHDSQTIQYHLGALFPCYDFSEDISRVSYMGGTVTYVCFQMAVYMGFREIYLLGVDCNYDKGSQNNHFIKEDKPDHMNHGVDTMLVAYQSAKKYADENGIKIYNATRGGMLEVFERVEFDSLFK